MSHTLVLICAFGLIAIIHHRAADKASALASVPFVGVAAHPAVLDTARDLAIHAMVYSANAPIHWL